MGDQRPPGTPGRLHGGQPELTGLAAIAQYGYGRQDPLTGRYEGYDIPPGHAAKTKAGQEVPVTWPEILASFDVLIQDFAAEYGIRLAAEFGSMTWAEFATFAVGLLARDSRLARKFAPPAAT